MIEIIPAIDLIAGRCVRLSQGDFTTETVYSDDPVAVARSFSDAGITRLHMVDLDGARRGAVANLPVLEKVARDTGLIIDFGGGIKTYDDLKAVFDAGASMAAIGSLAVRSPDTFSRWIDAHGAQRFLLGADVRDARVAINGWKDTTDTDVIEFLTTYEKLGVTRAFVTDIAKDGLLSGPSIELYRRILSELPDIELIASGGVSSLNDILALNAIGCSGVIVGKAIYEGRVTLKDLAALADK